MNNFVKLRGLTRAEALVALYEHSRPQGLGWMHFSTEALTIEEAEEALLHHDHVDYFRGRIVKVRLASHCEEFNAFFYDRDLGSGAAETAITSALETKRRKMNAS